MILIRIYFEEDIGIILTGSVVLGIVKNPTKFYECPSK